MFVIYTVPHCKWCDKAKELANELDFTIVEKDFYGPTMWDWEELIGFIPKTAPQIFLDGDHIGGCTDFMELISAERYS